MPPTSTRCVATCWASTARRSSVGSVAGPRVGSEAYHRSPTSASAATARVRGRSSRATAAEAPCAAILASSCPASTEVAVNAAARASLSTDRVTSPQATAESTSERTSERRPNATATLRRIPHPPSRREGRASTPAATTPPAGNRARGR